MRMMKQTPFSLPNRVLLIRRYLTDGTSLAGEEEVGAGALEWEFYH